MQGDIATNVKAIAAKQLMLLYSKQSKEVAAGMSEDKLRFGARDAMQHLPVEVDDALADLIMAPEVLAVLESLIGFADAMYTELIDATLSLIVSGDITDEGLAKTMQDYKMFCLFRELLSGVVALDKIGETED